MFSCPRIAHNIPVAWAEARRQCQQEGATLAVVNSEEEAEVLRFVYFEHGPGKGQRDDGGVSTEESIPEPPPEEITPTPEPANAIVHIGFHDIFIEGEYLTVRSK